MQWWGEAAPSRAEAHSPGRSFLRLEVTDGGCGFNVAEQEQKPAGPAHGLGLASLYERLSSLGGRCEISSQPGQGTRVTFRVPLPRRA